MWSGKDGSKRDGSEREGSGKEEPRKDLAEREVKLAGKVRIDCAVDFGDGGSE